MSVEYATSAFDGADGMSVEDALKDPLFIEEAVREPLNGAFLEEALFRNAGRNDGIVAYREASSPFLNDDVVEIAEFGEIPVSEPSRGKMHTLMGVKTGLAVRVSYEMRRMNRFDEMALRIKSLQETMIKAGVDGSLAAFDRANVETLQVSTAWDDDAADPVRDLRVAKRMVATAKAPEDENALMGYRPDTLVVGPGTMDLLLWHESTQRFYNGNVAADNPLFRGVTPQVLAGLRVVESSWFEEGEVLVMQAGVAGFISDTDPLTVSPFYEEGGASGHGGPRMSWRADAFRNRVIAVDNPGAVVRITGIGTP